MNSAITNLYLRGHARTTIKQAFLLAAIFSIGQEADAENMMRRPACPREAPSRGTKNLNVISSAYDRNGNVIALCYSSTTRRIFLQSKRFKPATYLVHRIENGASPELVGADSDIRILFGGTFLIKEREFLALTIAERTNRGSDGGECGAGAEIYMSVYELPQHEIRKRISLPVASCRQGIELQYPDPEPESRPLITLNNGIITIRWLNHPSSKYDEATSGPATGYFNVFENRLDISRKN